MKNIVRVSRKYRHVFLFVCLLFCLFLIFLFAITASNADRSNALEGSAEESRLFFDSLLP